MDFTLAGQLETWPTKSRLAAVLRAAGLNIRVGRYAIRLCDFDHFVFAELGGDLGSNSGTGLVDADADDLETFKQKTQLVSDALAQANLRHRFEIYNESDSLVAYIHHDWPQAGQIIEVTEEP